MRKAIIIICAIIFVIASCTKKSAPTVSKKVVDGPTVFSANCARCHGPEGIRDNKPNLQTMNKDKAAIIRIVTKGKERMPAFEDKLSQEEIAAVADLIVSWHKN